MSIALTERDCGYRGYVVSQGARRWIARHNVVTDQWQVKNDRGAVLDSYGPTASRIIAACEEYAGDLDA